MKLKLLASSLAVAGLLSTSAFAAPANTASKTPLQNSDFWMSVIHHNQDNASGVLSPEVGQTKITGIVETDLKNKSKRTGYANDKQNKKGSTLFSLAVAEAYVDSQINNFAAVHLALDYYPDFVAGNSSNTSAPTQMFLPEAYASLYYGHFWTNIGRQYANFGSTAHSSITTPVTDTMTKTNQTGVTLGYASMSTGLFGDVFLFNGAGVGKSQNSVDDSANNLHGFSVELGYAQNAGTNPFYDYEGFYGTLSYLSNVADTLTVGQQLQFGSLGNNTSTNVTGNSLRKAVGATSLDVGFTKGAFGVTADYVMYGKFDKQDMSFNKVGSSTKGATPSAYNIEASYGFMTRNHANVVTLGYEGTQEALGLTEFGGNQLPESRFLVNYAYSMFKNVKVELQYNVDQDYGTKYTSSVAGGTTGTGKSINEITARLKVAF